VTSVGYDMSSADDLAETSRLGEALDRRMRLVPHDLAPWSTARCWPTALLSPIDYVGRTESYAFTVVADEVKLRPTGSCSLHMPSWLQSRPVGRSA
jgi:hypothetical protein